MDNRKEQIEKFFTAYANRFNLALNGGDADINGTVKSFADCFVSANPLGVSCGKNDEAFRSAMLQGYTYYRNMGITTMEIRSKEITLLDEYHSMVKVNWKCIYIQDSIKKEMFFNVIYFLQTNENTLKIFAYITGDEQKALKDLGLLR